MREQDLILERHRQFDSEHDGKAWNLRGIFASTRPNANGRTYPRPVLEAAIGRYVDEHVRNGTAFGCLDHPDNAQVSLKDAAVLITSLEWIGGEVHGECTVLSTQQGQELQHILEAGGSVGMSTRGTGGVDSKGQRLV